MTSGWVSGMSPCTKGSLSNDTKNKFSNHQLPGGAAYIWRAPGCARRAGGRGASHRLIIIPLFLLHADWTDTCFQIGSSGGRWCFPTPARSASHVFTGCFCGAVRLCRQSGSSLAAATRLLHGRRSTRRVTATRRLRFLHATPTSAAARFGYKRKKE